MTDALSLSENGLDGTLPLETFYETTNAITELDIAGTYFEISFKSILETFPNLGKSNSLLL